MIYTVTLKGTIPQLGFDSILGRHFSDVGFGYHKTDIEAENEAEMIKKLKEITKDTDLKLIGATWEECDGNHELDEQPCTQCLIKTQAA